MLSSDTLRKLDAFLAAARENPSELRNLLADEGSSNEAQVLAELREQFQEMLGGPRDADAREMLAALDAFEPAKPETQVNQLGGTAEQIRLSDPSQRTKHLHGAGAMPDTVNAADELDDLHIPEHDPPPLTAEQLEAHIMQLGLLPERDISAIRESFSTSGNEANSRSFAAHLIQSGKLTKYQAGELLAGRGRTLVLGDYRLEEKLGQGGMGAVYRARHSRLGKRVAIKVLPRELTNRPDAVARFEREMQAVGGLHHPNIIQAHDAGVVNGVHFLSMELVDGKDVDAVFRSLGFQPEQKKSPDARKINGLEDRSTVPDCCEIIRQAALGLQHAHEKGLVHRDIKPSNLLLTRDGTVKILDLGLALLESGNEGELTSTGQVMGTLDYIAPEQVASTHHVDIRADLYSLGCTLYRLLTGHPPFPHPEYNTAARKMYAHSAVQPKPASEFREDLPAELLKLLDRLLAKKPEARYRTPRELAEAIKPFCKGANLPALFNPDQRKTQLPSSKSSGAQSNRASLPSPQAYGVTTPEFPVPSPQSSGERARVRGSSGSLSTTTSLRKPRPLLWIATGFFSVLILTGIIITIKDKDGNVVSKMEVPEGGSFNVEQTPSSSTPANTNSDIDLPEIEEPPPLDEWLKGREILTVKQDGTAMFTKIQDALDALKPGQVVEVLDKGPYEESFVVSPPENTGLISRVNARITTKNGISDHTPNGEQIEYVWRFSNADGFRIQGLAFVDERENKQDVLVHALLLESAGKGPTLLDCFVHSKASNMRRPKVNEQINRYPGYCVNLEGNGSVYRSVIVGRLRLGVRGGESSAIHCLIVAANETSMSLIKYNPANAVCILRDNLVWSRFGSCGIFGKHPINQVSITRNTFLTHPDSGYHGLETVFVRLKPEHLFCTQNCIVGYRGFQKNALCDDRGELSAGMVFRDNSIGKLEPPELQGLPILPTERLVKPKFISLDPLDRNFMRIKADPKFLIPETGEYIGALPPGPAPTEGDWFTELLDRWRPEIKEYVDLQKQLGEDESNPLAPAPSDQSSIDDLPEIEEPPPLDEWLKGREILTVKQDGTAMFTKIQDALNALKPGQVVEVLDKGPYEERLTVQGNKREYGLFSRVKARIHLPKSLWIEQYNDFHKTTEFKGHAFAPYTSPKCNFRISGLMFSGEAPGDGHRSRLIWSIGYGTNTFENCFFADNASTLSTCLHITRDESNVIIRNCVLQDTAYAGLEDAGSVVFANNLFFALGRSELEPWLTIAFKNSLPDRRAVGVMHVYGNVFTGTTKHCSLQHGIYGTPLEMSRRFCNNLVDCPSTGIQFGTGMNPGEYQIIRNVFCADRIVDIFNKDISSDTFVNTAKEWRIENNALPISFTSVFNTVSREQNVVSPIEFLSKDPLDRNFMRIKADPKFLLPETGEYIGALPPGPAPAEGDWFTEMLDRWRPELKEFIETQKASETASPPIEKEPTK